MFNNGADQKNLEEFTQELFSQLVTATRMSNNLPSEDEYQFYSTFKPFKSKMNEIGKRLLDITQNFLQHEDNTKAPVINDSYDVDEVTEKFDEVVDFVDRLIEKVVRSNLTNNPTCRILFKMQTTFSFLVSLYKYTFAAKTSLAFRSSF